MYLPHRRKVLFLPELHAQCSARSSLVVGQLGLVIVILIGLV